MTTKKKIAAALMALTMAFAAASCGSTSSEADAPKAAAVQMSEEYKFTPNEGRTTSDFNVSASDLSLTLFKEASKEKLANGKNACISPESLMLALGMAANGAGGETLAQFEKLFGGKNMEEINNELSAMISAAEKSKDLKLSIANSIWVREGDLIKMKPAFAELCKTRFDADAFVAPFDSDTLSKLNAWVKENTDGMIDSIKDSFSPEEVAVLLNAITFEAEWAQQYEDFQVHEDEEFTNSKGEKEKCTMLYSGDEVYLENSFATGFLKAYKGGEYSFAAILPNEGTSLEDCIDKLDGAAFRELLSSASTDYILTTALPEFKFDFSESLKEELAAMGIDKAFDPAADFTNMADTQTGQLYIGDVIHKTHIEVDRAGTRAAAVTEIELKCGSAMLGEQLVREVILDRPFVFAIVDNNTQLPLFIGAVNSVGA